MDRPPQLPRYVQVESVLEFSRLVCALEHPPRVSFLHEHGGSRVLSVQMDFLKDRPIIYYAPVDDPGRYLSYRVRGGSEESAMVDSASDKTRLYSPIVRIRSLPENMRAAAPGGGDVYHPVELEDLSSLANISYGLEEVPYPLFAFPAGSRWLMGMFMNFNEDGPSYFLHVSLEGRPDKPFLRYAMSGGAPPAFVDNPGAHGYSYVKIVRLGGPHPVVGDGRL